jgi:hypothetical protein
VAWATLRHLKRIHDPDLDDELAALEEDQAWTHPPGPSRSRTTALKFAPQTLSANTAEVMPG